MSDFIEQIQGLSPEEIQQEASKKGMLLVDSSGCEALIEEANEVIEKADELCLVIDPETKPYESKYKARELLDEIVKKLEANKTVMRLENKKSASQEISRKLAEIQVKLGAISWDCEEPHNAQTDLEYACQYYFPSIIEEILNLCPDTDELYENSAQSESIDNIALPVLNSIPFCDFSDAIRCLNLLGILWAGRGQPRKSLYYLLLSQELYFMYRQGCENQLISFSLSISNNKDNYISTKSRKDIENSYTHLLFYLAQAYGNIGQGSLSGKYCHMTLERQYNEGLKDLRSALDWVKNCSGLADYFVAMEQFSLAYLSLLSAEKVLKEKVIKVLYEQLNPEDKNNEKIKPNFNMGSLNAAEIEAELHRKFAIIDGIILKYSSEMQRERNTAKELGLDYEAMGLVFEISEEESSRLASLPKGTDNEGKEVVYFIESLPVVQFLYTNPNEIKSFESAREIFLRGASRIEASKKYFVLDGYVTDHSILLQEHSKLYHNLSIFETDLKRQLAMEGRRHTMLAPLLSTLAVGPYEVLHKQISFELGESALTQLDMKITLLKESGKAPKKSDIEKCNYFCQISLAMFSHFLSFYADQSRVSEGKAMSARGIDYYMNLPLSILALNFDENPDYGLISETESKPFLNAHFLSIRALTKILVNDTNLPSTTSAPPVNSLPIPSLPTSAIPPYPTHNHAKAHYLICAQYRYSWMSKFSETHKNSHLSKLSKDLDADIEGDAHSKNSRLAGLKRIMVVNEGDFKEQYKVCVDMASLLPSKIERIIRFGEQGLEW